MSRHCINKHLARMWRFIFCVFIAVVVPATIFSWSFPAWATESGSSGGRALLNKYAEIKGELEKNQFDMPLFLESEERGNSLLGDIYGVVNYPYYGLEHALELPADWCTITPLHFNVKACTYRKVDTQYQLTLYSGRKYYQPPSDAHKLKFQFRIITQTPDYLDIELTADKGPIFTKDYRLGLEAVSLDSARTFVHFSYSYRYGLLLKIFTTTYFATIGHGKNGFSVVATDKQGKPVYVKGIRGALERNAVRYYFALLAYLDSLKEPTNQRLEKRLKDWFDLTDKYPIQLHEMDREEYLNIKRKEHLNQLELQKKVDK